MDDRFDDLSSVTPAYCCMYLCTRTLSEAPFRPESPGQICKPDLLIRANYQLEIFNHAWIAHERALSASSLDYYHSSRLWHVGWVCIQERVCIAATVHDSKPSLLENWICWCPLVPI